MTEFMPTEMYENILLWISLPTADIFMGSSSAHKINLVLEVKVDHNVHVSFLFERKRGGSLAE